MDIEKLACGDGSLPSLPAAALKLLELSNDPHAELGDVIAVIESDPVLSARILAFANSRLYAKTYQVERLSRAVAVMGLSAAVNLALSFSLKESVGQDGGLHYPHFWRRSLASANAAAELGSAVMGAHAYEELFLAGLLQDIGVLVIDKLDPGFYQLLDTARPSHRELLAYERDRLGANHVTAGALLLKRWQLAERTVLAVEASHDAPLWPLTHELGPFMRSVALSGEVADFLILGESGAGFDALAERCWDLLRLDSQQLQRIVAQVNEKLPELEALLGLSAVASEPARDLGNEHLASDRRSSAAVSLKEQAESLGSDDGRRDPTTGVYSRGFLEEHLSDLFQTVRVKKRPLSLVFANVSNLGELHEHFGDAAGRILAGVARIFERNVRGGDMVVRFDEDVFLIVLPGANPEGAAIVCDRITKASSALQFPAGRQVLPVELAMGVATEGKELQFESAEDLLAAANLALFKANVSGNGKLARFERRPRTVESYRS